VNGDGYDDVLVGAPGYQDSTGRAYLYLGSSSGLASTADQVWTGSATQQHLGQRVTGAGDVDADGYHEALICADPQTSSSSPGGSDRIFLYAGSSSGLSGYPIVELGSRLCAVSAAGDVNADGYADVIVGDMNHDTYRGLAQVLLGSARGLSSSPAYTVAGEQIEAQMASVVSGAGDVDGDGDDDFLVGGGGGRALLGEGGKGPKLTVTEDGRGLGRTARVEGAGPGDRVLVYVGKSRMRDGRCLAEIGWQCVGLSQEELAAAGVANDDGVARLQIVTPSDLLDEPQLTLRAFALQQGEGWISTERSNGAHLFLGN
jgi:hypothetical protein